MAWSPAWSRLALLSISHWVPDLAARVAKQMVLVVWLIIRYGIAYASYFLPMNITSLGPCQYTEAQTSETSARQNPSCWKSDQEWNSK